MNPIDANTRLCAVIGNPVRHSMSPAIHNAAYDALGLNRRYLAFEVENLEQSLDALRALNGFDGFSVTIPHKTAIISLLDEVDEQARRVGSVNTVYKRGEALTGTTTDGEGALRALRQAGVELNGKRVLCLGSGGAVRAVAFSLLGEGIASLRILGRTPANVERLAADLSATQSGTVTAGSLHDDVADATRNADVIIQGTPAGMHGAGMDERIVPADALNADQAVFDMVYNPGRTPLIADAVNAGCTVVYGLEMLVHQAGLQFELWTGESAPLDAMRAAARVELGE